jgi:hypothetical protein
MEVVDDTPPPQFLPKEPHSVVPKEGFRETEVGEAGQLFRLKTTFCKTTDTRLFLRLGENMPTDISSLDYLEESDVNECCTAKQIEQCRT